MENINVSGPQGNAFYILGRAKHYAKLKGLDWPAIQKDMMSGDYAHLLDVFEKHFSDEVRLGDNPPEEADV